MLFPLGDCRQTPGAAGRVQSGVLGLHGWFQMIQITWKSTNRFFQKTLLQQFYMDRNNICSHVLMHGDVKITYQPPAGYLVTLTLFAQWCAFRKITFFFSLEQFQSVTEELNRPQDDQWSDTKTDGTTVLRVFLQTLGSDVTWATSVPLSAHDSSIQPFSPRLADSVHSYTFRQLHHHRRTIVQICIKVPEKLLGQVRFELLCSFTERDVHAGSAGKLEKVLRDRKVKQCHYG